MIKRVVGIAASLLLTTIYAQESESDLNQRLETLAAEVVSTHLRDPCRWPNPAVSEKQALLARAISEATPATGPLVLLNAVTANSLSDVRRLIEAGASREDPWGTPLHAAARFSDSEMLEYLSSVEFDLEDRGAASGSALLVAASENRLDNVKWLVENGADVNATDTRGVPVIRFALVCRSQELLDYLLEAGAVPDRVTRERAPGLGVSLGDR
jgi:ankyrin repeat protein